MATQNQPQKPSNQSNQKLQGTGGKMPSDNKQNFNSSKSDRATSSQQRPAAGSKKRSDVDTDLNDQEDDTSI